MAVRKAAGAEYDYGYHYGKVSPDPLAERKRQRFLARKNRASLAVAVAAYTFVITALFLTGLGYTFLQARLACLNWDLQKLKDENIVLAGQIEKTNLQIAKLKAPNRIEELAVTQLGMIKDPGIEYLVMNQVGKKEADTGEKELNRTTNDAETEKAMTQVAFGEVAGADITVGIGIAAKMPRLTGRIDETDNLFAKLYCLLAQAIGVQP
jgi:cell division protein FtsL